MSVWGLTSIKPFHYHGIHIRLHGKKTLKSISLCLPLCSAGSCGGSTNNHLYQDQPLLTFCCIRSESQSCLNIIVLMLRAGFLFKLLHDLHHDTLLWLTEWGWSSAAVSDDHCRDDAAVWECATLTSDHQTLVSQLQCGVQTVNIQGQDQTQDVFWSFNKTIYLKYFSLTLLL